MDSVKAYLVGRILYMNFESFAIDFCFSLARHICKNQQNQIFDDAKIQLNILFSSNTLSNRNGFAICHERLNKSNAISGS